MIPADRGRRRPRRSSWGFMGMHNGDVAPIAHARCFRRRHGTGVNSPDHQYTAHRSLKPLPAVRNKPWHKGAALWSVARRVLYFLVFTFFDILLGEIWDNEDLEKNNVNKMVFLHNLP